MVAFWADNWSGKGLLRDLFPCLDALENDKLVSVCSKLNEPHMDVSFRRTTRGGAEQNSGDFSVASIGEKIDEKRLPIVCSKTRWV
nr:RNA-directed DNA polymerase, eukaryota, reverse transcriptase zinc-binding domain protein [Tanacetum cinerariifolium]